jgi:ankyrin repeat protein
LLENGAAVFYDDDALSRDTSPIFLAIRMESKHILEEICDLNPDTIAKDSNGLTPLMFAAKGKKEDVI